MGVKLGEVLHRSTALPATLTFTATCSLAVFLEGPEASKELPSTSTDMVKMGAPTHVSWVSFIGKQIVYH